MKYKSLIIIALTIVAVLAVTSCKKRIVTEEMREHAAMARGNYNITGMLDLYPYEGGDTEHRNVDFSGRATVDTLANATLAISYISDKTGDTNSIVVAIDEAGILIFKRLKIDYNGIEASATTLESNIQRHGNDTVSGSAQLRLSIFNGLQTRQCDMDVVAVRAPL